MHTVAREYALRTKLTLAKLMDNLPRTNDPGCSAGYAHGLVTAVAPEIEKAGPTVANQLCAKSETRYQRYSCTHGFGHAFMRLNNDKIAARRCRCATQLGSGAAPDCSQGIYHDYWFAVNGIDDTTKPKDAVTDPRELCGAQPQEFVRAVLVPRVRGDRDGHAHRVRRAERREPVRRPRRASSAQACVTGASVIGPPDPRNQLAVCAALAGRHRHRGLHPRHEGPEPHQLPGRPAGRADQGLQRSSGGSMALDVLPLAGQDARRRQRRQVPHHGLPRAPATPRARRRASRA